MGWIKSRLRGGQKPSTAEQACSQLRAKRCNNTASTGTNSWGRNECGDRRKGKEKVSKKELQRVWVPVSSPMQNVHVKGGTFHCSLRAIHCETSSRRCSTLRKSNLALTGRCWIIVRCTCLRTQCRSVRDSLLPCRLQLFMSHSSDGPFHSNLRCERRSHNSIFSWCLHSCKKPNNSLAWTLAPGQAICSMVYPTCNHKRGLGRRVGDLPALPHPLACCK